MPCGSVCVRGLVKKKESILCKFGTMYEVPGEAPYIGKPDREHIAVHAVHTFIALLLGDGPCIGYGCGCANALC